MTRKRKKRKLTTKNTHINKPVKEVEQRDKKIPTEERVIAIVILVIGLYLIIMKACDNRVAGYDQWIGMPWIWR